MAGFYQDYIFKGGGGVPTSILRIGRGCSLAYMLEAGHDNGILVTLRPFLLT